MGKSEYWTGRLLAKQAEPLRGTRASLRPQSNLQKIGIAGLDGSVTANPETNAGETGTARGIPIVAFKASSLFNPQASMLQNISDFAFNYVLTNGSGNLNWWISGRSNTDAPVSGQAPIIIRPDGSILQTSNVVVANGTVMGLGTSAVPNVYNTSLGAKVYVVVGYSTITNQWIVGIVPGSPTASQISSAVSDGVIPIIAAHGDQAQVGVIGQGGTGALHGASSVGQGAASTLADDTDVKITAPTDGQVLTYVAADQKWENKTPAGATTPISVIAFDLTSEDQGVSINAVSRRIPLPANFTPTRVDAILEQVTGTVTFNIVWNNGNEINPGSATGAGATAVNGNKFFSSDQILSTASLGTIQSFTPTNAGAIYPVDGELTLRVATSATTGGVGNLKVVIAGSWS